MPEKTFPFITDMRYKAVLKCFKSTCYVIDDKKQYRSLSCRKDEEYVHKGVSDGCMGAIN